MTYGNTLTRSLLLLVCSASLLSAQTPQQPPANDSATARQLSPLPADPARTPIMPYIAQAWDTLTRSMSECKSVADTKVTTRPVLYLPAGMAVPPAVQQMQSQCAVDVEHLPRVIHHMGEVRPAELPREGLLYLPKPYVVPGGRFNEMYGWDSYFIILGLVRDGRVPLAEGMVDDFLFEVENYGAILNANRTYYFTRSQPPLLSSMIAEVYGQTHDRQWLAHAYATATQDYALWTSPAHRAGSTGLARYNDLGSGPVPEMADDSTYYPDVLRWLAAHPGVHPEYRVKASEHPDAAEAARLKETSCDLTNKVCAAAYYDGYRLSAAFYHGDRAMRESGFDTSFRFGPFSGSAEEFAPVCLNSLLFRYAQDMSSFAEALGKPEEAAAWTKRAEGRRAAVNKYLWHADTGRFMDYNFVSGQPSTYNFITMFDPLWSGLATPEQASAVRKQIPLFEHEGGLAESDFVSGVQWDLPFGWAPTEWLTVAGLNRYGFSVDAARLAKAFEETVRANYERDGTIREKYNVVSGSANIAVAAGYKTNVIGFGWTNGVYLSLEKLFAPAGQEPVQ